MFYEHHNIVSSDLKQLIKIECSLDSLSREKSLNLKLFFKRTRPLLAERDERFYCSSFVLFLHFSFLKIITG